jgi:antibiotic biosynthesis monooxygenase (ABM) superfamily enzyme
MGYEHQGRVRCHVDIQVRGGDIYRSVLVSFASAEEANKWLEQADRLDVLEGELVTHIVDNDNPYFDQGANAWKPSLTTKTRNLAMWAHTIESITKAVV